MNRRDALMDALTGQMRSLLDNDMGKLLDVFLKRIQSVNEQYLVAMGEHISDIGQLIPSDINRLVQMQRMQANLDAAKREIARVAEINLQELELIFEAAAQSDARFVAQRFGNEYKGSVLDNPKMVQLIKAQLQVTGGEFENLSQTTVASDAYRKAIDKGISTVQVGLESYNTAMRRAIMEAGSEGLQVKYSSGRKMRLDSAVRMNLLDGVRSLNNAVLAELGREFGADGVEISAHALCAEDHLPYQGMQYRHAEFERLQAKLDRPFGMWNCKHSMHPIIVGVSEPAYTDEELAQYRRNSSEQITIDGISKSRYEWTQVQRQIETAVRRNKDAAIVAGAGEGNMPLQRELQRKINALQDKYELISEAAGIKMDMSRMRVDGFKAVKTENKLKNPAERARIEAEKKTAWLKKGYDKAVEKGDISALTGFEIYEKVAQDIERELVGTTTSDGVAIAGYKTHFIDRIIGSYEKRREPVSIEDAKKALSVDREPVNSQRGNNPSRTYKGSECWVTINPQTAILIQASPRKKGV